MNVIGMPGHPMAPEIGEEILCMTCGFRPRTDLKLYRWESFGCNEGTLEDDRDKWDVSRYEDASFSISLTKGEILSKSL